jgi:hypothetical protein
MQQISISTSCNSRVHTDTELITTVRDDPQYEANERINIGGIGITTMDLFNALCPNNGQQIMKKERRQEAACGKLRVRQWAFPANDMLWCHRLELERNVWYHNSDTVLGELKL